MLKAGPRREDSTAGAARGKFQGRQLRVDHDSLLHLQVAFLRAFGPFRAFRPRCFFAFVDDEIDVEIFAASPGNAAYRFAPSRPDDGAIKSAWRVPTEIWS